MAILYFFHFFQIRGMRNQGDGVWEPSILMQAIGECIVCKELKNREMD